MTRQIRHSRADIVSRLWRARGGMTLMELMVSLAILAIMILMANSLLVRSRRTVRLAQEVIRANADVRAVTDCLRADLASLTNEGFLAITYHPDDLPHLIFTTASTYRSVVATDAAGRNISANAATIDFGLTADAYRILWRRARVQAPLEASSHDDCLNWALGGYRANLLQPRSAINSSLLIPLAPALPLTAAPAMTVPVKSLTDAMAVWPYLIADVGDLKIQWSDGARYADGRLVWYDRDNPKFADWYRRGADHQDLNLGEDAPEYNLSGPDANPRLYGAMWTFRKKDNWPKAIRFELGLGDPARSYEVVVALHD